MPEMNIQSFINTDMYTYKAKCEFGSIELICSPDLGLDVKESIMNEYLTVVYDKYVKILLGLDTDHLEITCGEKANMYLMKSLYKAGAKDA